MGKPLMIQPEDEKRIETLKEKLGARTKVDVVRAGLHLLEEEAERRDRISRWISGLRRKKRRRRRLRLGSMRRRGQACVGDGPNTRHR